MKITLSSFLQSRFNIYLYSIFGWWLARFYIFFLGRLYFILNNKEKQIITDAVIDVVGSTRRGIDIEKVIKKVFRGIFSHYYEKMFMAFEEKEKTTGFIKKNVLSDDLIVLNRCLSKGKGVILVTGHFGAIEYIPKLLVVNNFDVTVIAKFKTERLKQKALAQAKKHNVNIIDAENSGNILKTAIRELRENRVLITQCDEIEEWRLSEKNETSFLGQVTGLDRTINIIQKRTGAEVLFGVIHRYNLNEYRLIMYSYEDMLKMLGGVPLSTIGEIVLKVLEQFIYRYPEQWYQWKKYSEMRKRSIIHTKEEKPMSSPILQPAFGKVLY